MCWDSASYATWNPSSVDICWAILNMQVITRLPEIQERNRPAESLGACCCDCFVCNIRFTCRQCFKGIAWPWNHGFNSLTWFKSQIWRDSGNSSHQLWLGRPQRFGQGPAPGMVNRGWVLFTMVPYGPIEPAHWMGSRPWSKRVLQHPKILFRVHAASNAKLPCSRTHLQVQLTGIVQVDKDRIILYLHLSAGFWVSGWSLPGWFQPIQQYES